VITSATKEIYGEAIWEPIELGSRFESRPMVALAMFTVIIATLGVNIAANVVSPANDFANIAPKKISFRTGGLITGIIGILMMPWKLLADPKGYIFTWLIGYSGGLAAIAGVMICDYWIIRKQKLDVEGLYQTHGVYRYRGGFNVNAILATVFGCAVAWVGAFVPMLKWMYDYAWFNGLLASGTLYLALMRANPLTKPADQTR
jgi:nucleobase:cation symporter-1, NCS1 family